jgi:two-component system, NarL family, invasion response regulator UvrY
VIRILVADDHSVVRKGIKQIVADSPGMEVVGEAATGQEALELVRSGCFDLVILDISMPGRGGLEILRELKAEAPAPKVIILSMYPEEQYAIRCLRDGASAYLMKGSPPEELILAIETVTSGKRYITPSIADRLASYIEDSSQQPPHETLSDREMQILVLIGSGIRASDIAEELNLSVKTISTYRSRILLKMNMETNAQLIRYALQHGLVG